MKTESSDALVPIVKLLSAKDEHDPLRRIVYKDLLDKALEASRCQITNTTNKLHGEHSLYSSKAFFSTVTTLFTSSVTDSVIICSSAS